MHNPTMKVFWELIENEPSMLHIVWTHRDGTETEMELGPEHCEQLEKALSEKERNL